VSITPLRPLPGYYGTVFRRGRTDSDVMAHAVVFSDGARTVAFVSLDVTFIGRPEALRIKEVCQVRTGIPSKDIFIAANHAHSAPSVAASFLDGENPHPVYTDFLVERVVNAVSAAQKSMRPARMAAGNAPAPGIAFNRRLVRPDGTVVLVTVLQGSTDFDFDPSYPASGPVDNDIGYIWFEDLHGVPIGCLMSFACHNHSAGSLYFHRDMFGRTGDAIRQELGVAMPTVFVAGACGDVMWLDPKAGPPADAEAFTWATGRKLAAALLKHVRGAARREIADIRVATSVAEVPDRAPADSEYCDDHCRGKSPKDIAFASARYTPERAAVAVRGDTSCLVEISAVSVGGDVAVATNPAELFVEFGLEIKRRSPFKTTIISELTNGYCGYVPTEQGFRQKGYEAHRTVFTSRLNKQAGRWITERSVQMLEACSRPVAAHGAREVR